jgi:hypothetical protein
MEELEYCRRIVVASHHGGRMQVPPPRHHRQAAANETNTQSRAHSILCNATAQLHGRVSFLADGDVGSSVEVMLSFCQIGTTCQRSIDVSRCGSWFRAQTALPRAIAA